MRGAGDSVFPMVSVVASVILIRVPVLYYLANHFGPDYMYYGYGAAWILSCLASVWYYRSGRWLRKVLRA